jgi:hypothetical protein
MNKFKVGFSKWLLLGGLLLSSIFVFSTGYADPPSQAGSMDDLNDAVLRYLRGVGIEPIGPDMVVSVYVQDLESGDTLELNADVLHSGASVTKLGIQLAYFRESEGYPPSDERYTMAAAMICSSNGQANLLLESIGEGRLVDNLHLVNETFCAAGAGNTALLSPLYIGEEGFNGVPIGYYQPVRPAECSTAELLPDEPLFDVDYLNMMMPRDIGMLFAELYACAEHGNGLAAIFPNEIEPTECEWMVEVLSGASVRHLAELGLPEGVRFAHKVGYNAETVADAGIVYSEGGNYVIVVAIWERDVEHDGVSNLGTWHVVGELSRLVYNHFNPDAPLDRTRTPVNPIGAAACVLPINPDAVDFEDIDVGRFDARGVPLDTACFNWPVCEPFNGWEP